MKQDKFVLVTGATSGIGKALAEEFASSGYNLILVARKTELLEAIKVEFEKKYGVKIHTFSLDLTDRTQIDKLKVYIQENNLPLNILVNNAGAAHYGPIEMIKFQEQESIIDLNITSIVKIVDLFLPMLKMNNDSKILNVASIAALYPLPCNAIYGATKAFVLSYSKAIRYELKKSGISVCCLCPGDTNTNFFKNSGNENKKRKLMSPNAVAKQTLIKLFENEEVIFPSNVALLAKLPRSMLEKGIKKIMDKSRNLSRA